MSYAATLLAFSFDKLSKLTFTQPFSGRFQLRIRTFEKGKPRETIMSLSQP